MIGRRNEASPKPERNMKTRNLLLTIGATMVAAITINVTASDALLSPRAASSQTRYVSGTANDVNLVTAKVATVSPRAAANQTKHIAGKSNDASSASLCSRHMIGSPKAIAACAENPLAPMPCCTVAMAK